MTTRPNDSDEQQTGRERLDLVVEWCGQSNHGTLVIDCRVVNMIREGFEPRLRLIFESADVPYRAGAHFWIEALVPRRPPMDREDS